MKGLLLITNYFEDSEGLTTLDILRRAQLEVDLVSLKETLEITTQSNVKIVCDKLIENIDVRNYDFLVIPGGRAVMAELKVMDNVKEIIHHFVKSQKLVATICAAPYLVGELGYLKDKNYTCFPGFEKMIIGGKKKDSGVVVDGAFITARSMAYSVDFALAIIEYLLGKETRKNIKKSIFGE